MMYCTLRRALCLVFEPERFPFQSSFLSDSSLNDRRQIKENVALVSGEEERKTKKKRILAIVDEMQIL